MRTDERIRELERTLAREPGDSGARLALARELGRTGNREASAEHVDAVLAGDPLHAGALAALDEHGLSPLARRSPWPTVAGGNDRARMSALPGARRGKLSHRIRIGAPAGQRGRGDVERVVSLTVGGTGVAYLATDLNRLVALHLESRETLWIRELAFPFAAPTVGAGERLALASGDTVRLIEGRTGETLWIARSPGVVTEQPVPANATFAPRGLVLIPGIRGVLDARDAATGLLRWRLATRGGQCGAPAVVGSTVFVACSAGQVSAVDLDGRLLARVAAAEREVPWTPVVLPGHAYLVSARPLSKLHAIPRVGAGLGGPAAAIKVGGEGDGPSLGCALGQDRLLVVAPSAVEVDGQRARARDLRPGLSGDVVADSGGCFFGFAAGPIRRAPAPDDRGDLAWFDSTGALVGLVRDLRRGPIAVGPDSTLLVPTSQGILQVVG